MKFWKERKEPTKEEVFHFAGILHRLQSDEKSCMEEKPTPVVCKAARIGFFFRKACTNWIRCVGSTSNYRGLLP